MEVITAAGSPIALMTLDRTMAEGKQEHKIRWVSLANCPDGYIIQRITRDTKTSWGVEQTDRNGLPNGKVDWAKPTVKRADYYEMWEVWNGVIYPSKSSQTGVGMYHSHAGIQPKAWFGLRYIDPAAAGAANPAMRARGGSVLDAPVTRGRGTAVVAAPDIFHDVFTDTVPDCKPGQLVKGTNKILGKVYFFPRNSPRAATFIDKYLREGERNKVWAGTYTGGILLQFDAAVLKEPDKRFLQITRYESIEFSGSRKGKKIWDRGYPGIGRKNGQGVVNARNANIIYGAGTATGPGGNPLV